MFSKLCGFSRAQQAAPLQRIHDAQELKLMKIGIRRANLGDSVLSHESGNVKVVHGIPAYAGVLTCEIANHFRVALRFGQDSKGRRGQESLDNRPSLSKSERMRKDMSMRDDTKEFINSRPSGKPWLYGRRPLTQQCSHSLLSGEIFVCSINQQVGINNEHDQPFFLAPYSRASRSASNTRYNSSRSAMLIKGGPILKLGSRRGSLCLGFSRKPWRRNSVANSESVSPRSTARRLRSLNTGSGMIKVVFIRKNIESEEVTGSKAVAAAIV